MLKPGKKQSRRIFRICCVIVLLTLFVIIALEILSSVATSDVRSELKVYNARLLEAHCYPLSPGLKISLRRVTPSLSHLIVFEFDVQNESKLSSAVWYAAPWRKVILSK